MKKIFLDTNVVFWILKKYIEIWELNYSFLLEKRNNYLFYISDYVIYELDTNFKKKYNIDIIDHLKNFLEIVPIIIKKSNILDKTYLFFVNDEKDAQILQDAIEFWCNYLLTKNIKDFDVNKIKSKLNLDVLNRVE